MLGTDCNPAGKTCRGNSLAVQRLRDWRLCAMDLPEILNFGHGGDDFMTNSQSMVECFSAPIPGAGLVPSLYPGPALSWMINFIEIMFSHRLEMVVVALQGTATSQASICKS